MFADIPSEFKSTLVGNFFFGITGLFQDLKMIELILPNLNDLTFPETTDPNGGQQLKYALEVRGL
eukprot:UN04766